MSTEPNTQRPITNEWKVEQWEGEDYIITGFGLQHPSTFRKSEAERICAILKLATPLIINAQPKHPSVTICPAQEIPARVTAAIAKHVEHSARQAEQGTQAIIWPRYCDECGGKSPTHAEDCPKNDTQQCPRCNGVGLSTSFNVENVCTMCDGEGVIQQPPPETGAVDAVAIAKLNASQS